MEICHCFGINERQVRQAVDQGAGSLFDVMGCLGAGTGCGNCQADLRQAIERARLARDGVAQACGCSSTSSTTPINSSVGISLNSR